MEGNKNQESNEIENLINIKNKILLYHIFCGNCKFKYLNLPFPKDIYY